MDVNPIDALTRFEDALNKRTVKIQSGGVHKDLRVHLDHPDGRAPRFTYALTKRVGNFSHGKTRVVAIAVMVMGNPHKGLPRFQVAYATAEDERGKGQAKNILRMAIDELHAGMARNGLPKIYVEAVIDENNLASINIANEILGSDQVRNVLSNERTSINYIKLVG